MALLIPQIPVVNSGEALADVVRADLVARGVVPSGAHVVYANGPPGERTTPGQASMPRVWLWLDDNFAIDVGQLGDPATAVPMSADVDGQFVDAGMSIGVDKLLINVLCQAKDPEESTSPVAARDRDAALLAERACQQLKHRAYAAIWRRCAGSFRVVRGKNFTPKGSEFSFGSACMFTVELSIHIADDAYPANVADQSTGTQEAEGEQVAEVVEP